MNHILVQMVEKINHQTSWQHELEFWAEKWCCEKVKNLPANYTSLREDLLTVDQTETIMNPLLQGVSLESVPNCEQRWMGEINLTTVFESFRRNAINTLKKRPKLTSAIEALSLNNIVAIFPEAFEHYKIEPDEWNNLVVLVQEEIKGQKTEHEERP